MIATVTKSAPLSADELWHELMSVDDFIELMARQPKQPYMHDISEMEYYDDLRKEINDTAYKWGFVPKRRTLEG